MQIKKYFKTYPCWTLLSKDCATVFWELNDSTVPFELLLNCCAFSENDDSVLVAISVVSMVDQIFWKSIFFLFISYKRKTAEKLSNSLLRSQQS